MKSLISKIVPMASVSLLTACMASTGGTAMQQGTVLVSEVVSICGAVVGDQAEQRINQEWAKYPEAEVSRPMIENVAQVLLSSPDGTNAYSKYMTCAAGLFATKEVVK